MNGSAFSAFLKWQLVLQKKNYKATNKKNRVFKKIESNKLKTMFCQKNRKEQIKPNYIPM
jgi:hypothetical protein